MSDFLMGLIVGVMLLPSVIGAIEMYKWYFKRAKKKGKAEKDGVGA